MHDEEVKQIALFIINGITFNYYSHIILGMSITCMLWFDLILWSCQLISISFMFIVIFFFFWFVSMDYYDQMDENLDVTKDEKEWEDQDGVPQMAYDIEEKESRQMEDINQGIETRLRFDMVANDKTCMLLIFNSFNMR